MTQPLTTNDAITRPADGERIDLEQFARSPQLRRAQQGASVGNGDEETTRGRRAVLYLRVSSKKQVTTDYDPEGISLPAQRLACQRKVEQLGLDIVEEYVEPGRSGTEAAHRPRFQEMLERIRKKRDVDYVIVYKLSRLHRNRYDEAFTMAELQKRGVTLVSATESIDGTPVGQLMQGILSAFNQFRSAEDGADIAYKLGEKAKKGGTVFMAPLGYFNTGVRVEDREVRTVVFDEERAPLVKLAFELYATGKYSIPDLADELYLRGLRTRASGRWPSQQLSDNQLLRLLQDPYYLGFTRFKNQLYPGRHEALVDGELFARVQEVVAMRSTGERQRIHHHYLKSTLYCGRCFDADGRHGRVVLANVKARGGTYEYFFCRLRQEHLCDAPYMQTQRVEDAIERFWERIRVSDAFLAAARKGLQRTIDNDQAAARSLHAQLAQNLRKLDLQQENLIDLAADGALPREVVQKRMNAIAKSRAAMSARLERTEQKLAAVLDYLDAALSVLERPGDLYRAASDEHRRMLNQAVFARIYVFADEVTDAEFNEPFDMLLAAEEVFNGNTKTTPETRGGKRSAEVAAFVNIASGDVSSNDDVVGPVGLEPTTRGLKVRCSAD